MSFSSEVVEHHEHHRDVNGGWLRPATFGVMDGLVSNFSLVAGVLGGGASSQIVVITGLAGLVAGACSMASGEFTSVASQSDLARAEIDLERRELRRNPESELRELTHIFKERGLEPALAAQVAHGLSADEDVALRVHVKEELGIDVDDLPSPWLAAGSSFAAFSVGALVPVLPFLFGGGSIMLALILSVLGLVVTGGIVAKLTARPFWFGGGRQLLLGGISAAVTYGVGLLVGTGLS